MVETISAQPLASSAVSTTAPHRFEPGMEFKATVDANLPGGVVRLATADAKIDLRVRTPLPPGSEVIVTVSGNRQTPEIQITMVQPGEGRSAAAQPGTTTPAPPPAPHAYPGTPSAPPAGASAGTAQTLASSLPAETPPAAPPAASTQTARTIDSVSRPPVQTGPPNTEIPVVSGGQGTGQVAARTPVQTGNSQGTGAAATVSAPTEPRQIAGTEPDGFFRSQSNAGTAAPKPVLPTVTQTVANPAGQQAGGTPVTVSQAVQGSTPANVSANTATPSAPPAPVSTPGAAASTSTPQGSAASFTPGSFGSSPKPQSPAPDTTNRPAPVQPAPVQSAPVQSALVQPAPPGVSPPPGAQTGPIAETRPNQPSGLIGSGGPPVPVSPSAGKPEAAEIRPPPASAGPVVRASVAGQPVSAPLESARMPGQPAAQAAPLPGVPGASTRSVFQPAPPPPVSQSDGTVPVRTSGTPVTGTLQNGVLHTGMGLRVAQNQTYGAVPKATVDRPPVTPGAGAAQDPAPAKQIARQLVQPLTEQQSGLGSLFAQVGTILSAQAAGKVSLPDPVARAMQQILGLRLNAGQNLTGSDVQEAVRASGQFREAGLAAHRTGGSLPPVDLKTALLSLRSILQQFGAQTQLARPATQPATPSLNGTPQAQPQQSASGFWAGAAPQNLQSLLQETDAALARIRITQLVNSGLAGDERPSATARPMDLVLELPLSLGQETGVMQMQIGRDGGGQGESDETEPAWRLRFAMDLTATGPLEAAVSLRGGGTFVSLWVERKQTFDDLNAARATIEAAFADAGLDLQEFRLVRGLPQRTAAKYGALIDRQS